MINDGVEHRHRLHGDRSHQRHPLLLPGLCRQRGGNRPRRATSSTPFRAPCRRRPTLTAAPTNLSGQIRLTWLAPTSNGGSAITDYIIQRSPDGIDRLGDDQRRRQRRHDVHRTGLTNGTRYYFRVFADNAAGHEPGEQHRQRHPADQPSAPRSLAAAPTNVSGQIRLTWMAPASNGGSAITDYIIQRSPNGSTGWVTINDGVSTTTTYTVDRSDQRHPLLLPGLRQQRRRTEPGEQHRQRHPRTSRPRPVR